MTPEHLTTSILKRALRAAVNLAAADSWCVDNLGGGRGLLNGDAAPASFMAAA
jgi:hypothetical protein